ncbi:MAG: hypothetical protein AAGK04_00335 [Planctomycetota bacterium]
MSDLIALWIPTVAAAAACFILSTLFWTALPLHDRDYNELPDPDAFNDFFAAQKIRHGEQYMFPFSRDKKHMSTPEFQERYNKGPWGTLRVFPGKANMGKNIVLTFAYFLISSFLIGYVLSVALEPGAAFARVFQLGATVGVLAHTTAPFLNHIWFRPPGRAMLTGVVDGVTYGLVTGLVFAWQFPEAATSVPA